MEMRHERHTARESRSEWVGVALALVGAAVLGTLAGTRVSDPRLERTDPVRVNRTAALAERLSAVDVAVTDGDRSRAILAWWDAYGLALATRRWDAMATVGDAALTIDTLTSSGRPGFSGFRAEARRAYLVALFRARDAGAPEGIERVAHAFAALGDDEVAARARSIRVEAGR
jgi:hypothetical protein